MKRVVTLFLTVSAVALSFQITRAAAGNRAQKPASGELCLGAHPDHHHCAQVPNVSAMGGVRLAAMGPRDSLRHEIRALAETQQEADRSREELELERERIEAELEDLEQRLEELDDLEDRLDDWEDEIADAAEDALDGWSEQWEVELEQWAEKAEAWGEEWAQEAEAISEEWAHELEGFEGFEDEWSEELEDMADEWEDFAEELEEMAEDWEDEIEEWIEELEDRDDCGDCDDCGNCRDEGRCGDCEDCGDDDCETDGQRENAPSETGVVMLERLVNQLVSTSGGGSAGPLRTGPDGCSQASLLRELHAEVDRLLAKASEQTGDAVAQR